MTFDYRWKRAVDVARCLGERRQLDERELWPRERLLAFQRAELGELVAFASRKSPFYRELYGGAIDARDVELAKLPTLDKATMMANFDRVVTDPRLRLEPLSRHVQTLEDDDLYLGEFRVMASSGTTGRSGIYVYDRRAWRTALAGLMRTTNMIGVGPRLPRRRRGATIGAPGGKQMTYRLSKTLDVGLHVMCRLSATERVERLVDVLDAFQPEFLNAYPSIAAMLAAEQLDGRLHIAPSVVCTTSEVRTDEVTDRIRRAWGVEPFNCLGSTETGIAAVDCSQHRGMHVFEDLCILEVVDGAGQPVPVGRPGARVLVTNLFNRVQPLIRFEISDIVTIDDAPCPCGRSSIRVTALDGRTDDVLELRGEGDRMVRVHPIHLEDPMAAQAAVAQYQVIQRRDRLDVLVVLRAGAAAEQVQRSVHGALAEKLGGLGVRGTTVNVDVVDRIEREAAGKLKLIKRAAS